MTDPITNKAMEYATSIIDNPSEHHDAVFSVAQDFSQGANWMMEKVCEFLKQDLRSVTVYSGKMDDDTEIVKGEIVFVNDNKPEEFIARLRETIMKGE